MCVKIKHSELSGNSKKKKCTALIKKQKVVKIGVTESQNIF